MVALHSFILLLQTVFAQNWICTERSIASTANYNRFRHFLLHHICKISMMFLNHQLSSTTNTSYICSYIPKNKSMSLFIICFYTVTWHLTDMFQLQLADKYRLYHFIYLNLLYAKYVLYYTKFIK
ncbi:hypothetical protein BS78_07G000500 [Paspalum vaginatum]|nr:hypothetical protein BS78_07G000500 [Paspalum vaginatum]KAJ1266728.1 hypothetical protein BS78_07G000500 [Paspalum vaginatum]